MKKFAITLLCLALIGSLAFAWFSQPASFTKTKSGTGKNFKVLDKKPFKKIKTKATEAKKFINANNYNNTFCFLVDMSMGSGQMRFFVYDLEKDSILKNGLVTHGRCNEDWLEGRRYGNKIGCGCTSLGKYKIGYPYTGRFGLAFKLYGLDSTNSNAFNRYVVLHSHECVPESEVSNDICQSDGCPTVAPGFLKELEPMIKNSNKPVLLWIFN